MREAPLGSSRSSRPTLASRRHRGLRHTLPTCPICAWQRRIVSRQPVRCAAHMVTRLTPPSSARCAVRAAAIEWGRPPTTHKLTSCASFCRSNTLGRMLGPARLSWRVWEMRATRHARLPQSNTRASAHVWSPPSCPVGLWGSTAAKNCRQQAPPAATGHVGRGRIRGRP